MLVRPGWTTPYLDGWIALIIIIIAPSLSKINLLPPFYYDYYYLIERD